MITPYVKNLTQKPELLHLILRTVFTCSNGTFLENIDFCKQKCVICDKVVPRVLWGSQAVKISTTHNLGSSLRLVTFQDQYLTRPCLADHVLRPC